MQYVPETNRGNTRGEKFNFPKLHVITKRLWQAAHIRVCEWRLQRTRVDHNGDMRCPFERWNPLPLVSYILSPIKAPIETCKRIWKSYGILNAPLSKDYVLMFGDFNAHEGHHSVLTEDLLAFLWGDFNARIYVGRLQRRVNLGHFVFDTELQHCIRPSSHRLSLTIPRALKSREALMKPTAAILSPVFP